MTEEKDGMTEEKDGMTKKDARLVWVAHASCHPREGGDPVINYRLRGNDKKRAGMTEAAKATFELCQIADKNSAEAGLEKRIIMEVME